MQYFTRPLAHRSCKAMTTARGIRHILHTLIVLVTSVLQTRVFMTLGRLGSGISETHSNSNGYCADMGFSKLLSIELCDYEARAFRSTGTGTSPG